MGYKIYSFAIKTLGYVFILFLALKSYRYFDYRSDLRNIYQRCIYLQKDMPVEKVYKILGTEIRPSEDIGMYYDSIYYHSLVYPELYEQLILEIRFDKQRKIIDDFPKECPCYDTKAKKIVLPNGFPL